jgi:hypothetical protein
MPQAHAVRCARFVTFPFPAPPAATPERRPASELRKAESLSIQVAVAPPHTDLAASLPVLFFRSLI